MALGLTVVGQGPAAGNRLNVTEVRGSAFGYHAFNISLFGGAQPEAAGG